MEGMSIGCDCYQDRKDEIVAIASNQRQQWNTTRMLRRSKDDSSRIQKAIISTVKITTLQKNEVIIIVIGNILRLIIKINIIEISISSIPSWFPLLWLGCSHHQHNHLIYIVNIIIIIFASINVTMYHIDRLGTARKLGN